MARHSDQLLVHSILVVTYSSEPEIPLADGSGLLQTLRAYAAAAVELVGKAVSKDLAAADRNVDRDLDG